MCLKIREKGFSQQKVFFEQKYSEGLKTRLVRYLDGVHLSYPLNGLVIEWHLETEFSGDLKNGHLNNGVFSVSTLCVRKI